MSEHQHEKWQLLDSAQGGQYCGACGDHVQVIPEAAVEAATRAFFGTLALSEWDDLGPLTQEAYRAKARAALEAAVPHLRATALRDAAEEFAARLPDGAGNGRAYNSYQVASILRTKADELSAK